MASSNTPVDVCIIGAGLSGLMAARECHQLGLSTIIIEAADEVGGRMATFSIGDNHADTGAQFFTVRSPRFDVIVQQWLEAGLIFEWATGFQRGSDTDIIDGGHPRYASTDGMASLMQALAGSLTVKTGDGVARLAHDGDQWVITTRGERTYHARAVILTPPAPQSLGLLDASDITLSDTDRAALEAIRYEPCICGVVTLNGPSGIPAPGAIQQANDNISWIADNQQKGLSDNQTLITVHGSTPFSRLNWRRGNGDAVHGIGAALQPLLPDGTTIARVEIIRWQFALPSNIHEDRTLVAADLPPLAFAGDAFGGPRVEGAALSGLAAADAIADRLEPEA